MKHALFWLVAALAASGCGEPSPATDAGAMDAGSMDASAGDAEAGPSVIERDAGSPECTPGATETMRCGNCGTRTRSCDDEGVWVEGPCTGEGECRPDDMQISECGNCGLREDRCSAECVWIRGGCSGQGECMPGARETTPQGCPDGEVREVTCSVGCTAETTRECQVEACSEEGATETVSCGSMCGSRERVCTGGAWSYGACTDEGACVPGSISEVSCGNCGTQEASCDATCALVPATECTGEGVCSRFERTRTGDGCPPGELRVLRCDAECGFTEEVEACRVPMPTDVLFLVDASSSNWVDFRRQLTVFNSQCLAPLLANPDVHVGLAFYGDLGTELTSFVGAVELGAGAMMTSAIVGAVARQPELRVTDDATMEALTILTGGTPQPGAEPFVCSAGRVPGGCWRPEAQRVIVLHTDEVARGGPNPADDTLYNPWPSGPSWSTVQPRLAADGTTLLVMLDDAQIPIGDPLGMYEEMVTDLSQPASDVVEEDPDIDVTCAAVVARIQALTGR